MKAELGVSREEQIAAFFEDDGLRPIAKKNYGDTKNVYQ
jgi:hypothetical protein